MLLVVKSWASRKLGREVCPQQLFGRDLMAKVVSVCGQQEMPCTVLSAGLSEALLIHWCSSGPLSAAPNSLHLNTWSCCSRYESGEPPCPTPTVQLWFKKQSSIYPTAWYLPHPQGAWEQGECPPPCRIWAVLAGTPSGNRVDGVPIAVSQAAWGPARNSSPRGACTCREHHPR